MRLNNKAQFDNHEITADGVMVELYRVFGDNSEMLNVCDDEQLRQLLVKFGASYSNVEDSNRLELLYLLCKKIVTQDDALRIAEFFTEKFGASEDDEVLLHLCEGLIDYTALFEHEDDEAVESAAFDAWMNGGGPDGDEDDDEEDQTVCDNCGQDFDSVGRCGCATSYDYDEDHKEDSAVIKPKATSEVLETNYTNGVNALRDDVVLPMIPYIITTEGADTHLHTAEQVRLWLQQATQRDLEHMLHHIVAPDEDLRNHPVVQQNPNLFSEKHMVLLEILNELHPQDPPEDEIDEDDDAADENFAFKS